MSQHNQLRIIYVNNTFVGKCDIFKYRRILLRKSPRKFGYNSISILLVDGRSFILKTIPIRENKENEFGMLTQLMSNQRIPTISYPLSICQDELRSYIVLPQCEYDIDYIFIQQLDIVNFNSLLSQLLMSVFILNHMMHIYHNDLYYHGYKSGMLKLNNLMCFKLKSGQSEKIVYDKYIINIDHILLKIIDFGHGANIPNFRTTEIHSKYFPEIPYVSELLGCAYVFNLARDVDKLNFFKEMSQLVLKNTDVHDTKTFDQHFLDIYLHELKF